MKSLLDELKENNIITKKNKINPKAEYLLKNKYPKLFNKIIEFCNNGLERESITAKIIRVWEDIKIPPKCDCGKQIACYSPGVNRYVKYCYPMCDYARAEALKIQKNTLLKKYGCEHPIQIPKIKEQIIKTNLERYGATSPTKNVDIAKKMSDNYKKNYTSAVREKQHITNNKLFGANTYAESLIPIEIRDRINDKNWLYNEHIINKKSFNKIAKEQKITIATISKKMKKFNIGHIFYNMDSISLKELEIKEFIQNNYSGTLIFNDRKVLGNGKELDIYIPDLNLAIEFHGIFWHSQLNGKKDEEYHRKKMLECKEKNIKLIQIFETEWDNKKDIIKAKLLNLLNNSNILYAKDCEIKQISSKEAKLFLNENHLSGYVDASVYSGLTKDTKLVFLMSFSKLKHSNYDYKITQFTAINGTIIVDGVNKLFKHFIKTHECKLKIVAYCDYRWSNGNVYKKMGMEYIGDSDPNYFYFKVNVGPDNRILLSKTLYQKIKVNVFDPNKLEWDNMQANGYDRVWDCGSGIFTYN